MASPAPAQNMLRASSTRSSRAPTLSVAATTSILRLPNELLFDITDRLDPRSFNCLLRTCSFFAELLTPVLWRLAKPDRDDLPALLWATIQGNLSLVTFLLRMGVDIEITQNQRFKTDTALHKAAKARDMAMFTLLLVRGANIEALGEYDMRPLHHAALSGLTEMVRVLLECGADIEAVDRSKNSPLFYAVRFDHGEIVKMLLEKGADVQRYNLLHVAVYWGHLKVVELLLEYGADIHAQGCACGETPLEAARGASFRNLDKFRIIKTLEKQQAIEDYAKLRAAFLRLICCGR